MFLSRFYRCFYFPRNPLNVSLRCERASRFPVFNILMCSASKTADFVVHPVCILSFWLGKKV